MTEYIPKQLRAKRTINGVEWTCWSVGIMSTEWRATGIDAKARRTSPYRTTYTSIANGKIVSKLHRTQEAAMVAAQRKAKGEQE